MKLQSLKSSVQMVANRVAPLPPVSSQSHYRVRGRQLQRIRDRHFNVNPLCVMCMEQGIVSVATELDHIRALSHGGTDTDDNRQGLCSECHRAKTLVDLQSR